MLQVKRIECTFDMTSCTRSKTARGVLAGSTPSFIPFTELFTNYDA